MKTMEYHNPVLLKESVDALVVNPDGIYVDCTFGGGGHSREILSRLSEKGRLISFDQDEDAKGNIIADDRFQLVMQNFRFLKNNLRYLGIKNVSGVLADLGVSSHQFDTPERGFSIRFDGDLDMRMNQSQKITAAKILNEYEESALADVFYNYGELRTSRRMAREVVSERKKQPFKTTEQLKQLFSYIPKNKENKFLAQVFQALRIEVNDEMAALRELLMQCGEIIEPGGKMVMISYHSLEDRLVKRYMKMGMFEGEPERDVFGNWDAPFSPVQSKVIVPSEEEIEKNPRARSAKMRVAIKN
ncbi:16S rRNA (cytosine(1402)-N(4))-methyltransferase RsmH [Moheibacter sp.]|uniref:16S rRNA (cytosine(1402)-N(4))-methyltransferase RsmH n=1 Tax=Moheibacter sp. TaxID=1965316 RepID=UPI003C74D1C4